MKIEIEDLKKVKLNKSDVLLVKIDSTKVTDEDMLVYGKILKDVFPNNSVIFCPTESDISVIVQDKLNSDQEQFAKDLAKEWTKDK